MAALVFLAVTGGCEVLVGKWVRDKISGQVVYVAAERDDLLVGVWLRGKSVMVTVADASQFVRLGSRFHRVNQRLTNEMPFWCGQHHDELMARVDQWFVSQRLLVSETERVMLVCYSLMQKFLTVLVWLPAGLGAVLIPLALSLRWVGWRVELPGWFVLAWFAPAAIWLILRAAILIYEKLMRQKRIREILESGDKLLDVKRRGFAAGRHRQNW